MSISPLDSVPFTSAPASAPAQNNGAGSSNSGGSAAANSISSLTPLDFIQMLAAQLQNQDPTNPTDPSQILQQTSTIAQMESMTSMTSSLSQEQASGLIGKTVTGGGSAGTPITGAVTDVQIDPSTGTPSLMVNGTAIPLASVTDISS